MQPISQSDYKKAETDVWSDLARQRAVREADDLRASSERLTSRNAALERRLERISAHLEDAELKDDVCHATAREMGQIATGNA